MGRDVLLAGLQSRACARRTSLACGALPR
jgi:hypothetical protein